ncbi:MerR family transcriptional regulator [Evansella halocellulosilytica]|uniref:MerR family transcriptional regulator n=1 Tax=Evansella halocellulosilytica TaxID=2011013 RepID=UPI000BB7FC02|nr:MerR family transcriptional regulator [Evansella halocellulosilytica]
MKDMTYTISEFARRTGLTVRTLRFYEEVNLLVPKNFNDAGHRLYGIDELKTLQQIQSLKFIGYSLQEIQQLLRESTPYSESFEKSLSMQHKLLTEKRDEIDRARNAVETMQVLLQQGHELNWSIVSPLLHSMKNEEEHKEWMKEYFSEDFVNNVYNLSKEERQSLDIEWVNLLAKLKTLVKNNVSPQSDEAKAVLLELIDLVFKYVDKEEFTKGLEENYEEISKDMDDFRFPNFFTEEEEQFLDSISKAFEEGSQNQKDE